MSLAPLFHPEILEHLREGDQGHVTLHRLRNGSLAAVKEYLNSEAAKDEFQLNQKAFHACPEYIVKALKHSGSHVIFENYPDYIALDQIQGQLDPRVPVQKLAFYAVAGHLSRAIRCFLIHDLLHTDLKPRNVLFNPDSYQAKLIDFGDLHVLSTQEKRKVPELHGTPGYFSPWLFTLAPVTQRLARNALWALTGTLLNLLPGKKLFNDMAFPEADITWDHTKDVQFLIARVDRWFHNREMLQKQQKVIDEAVSKRTRKLYPETKVLLQRMVNLTTEEEPLVLLQALEEHCFHTMQSMDMTEKVLRVLLEQMKRAKPSRQERDLTSHEREVLHRSLVEHKEEIRTMSEKDPLGEVVGKGGFGQVFAWKEHGVPLVMKKIKVQMKVPGQVFNEVNVMHNVEHPFLMAAKDIHWFEGGEEVGIVMDRARCNMQEWNFPPGPEGARQIKTFMAQTLLGLCALHQKHMIHFDVKPQNFLVMNEKHVKVSDFGLLSFMCQSKHFYYLQGTLKYMPPEVVCKISLHKKSPSLDQLWAVYTQKTDSWSWLISWFFLLGDATVHSLEGNKVTKALKMLQWLREKFQDDQAKKEFIVRHIKEPALQAFFFRNLQFDEAKRPTCWELLQDPLLKLEQHVVPLHVKPWPQAQALVLEDEVQRTASFLRLGEGAKLFCQIFNMGKQPWNEINFITIQAYLFYERILHARLKRPADQLAYLCVLLAFATFFPRLKLTAERLTYLEEQLCAGKPLGHRWNALLEIFRGLGQNLFGLHMGVTDWSHLLKSRRLDTFLTKEDTACFVFTAENSLVKMS